MAVIWDPNWRTEKKIGILATGVAAFSILVVVLTFVCLFTVENKQKMNSNNETSTLASNLGK